MQVPPPIQGSPYIKMFSPPGSASSAARTAFIVSASISAIRSKRKPSTWYSFAQYTQESTMYLRIMLRSLAMSQPQPEPLVRLPSGVRRQ